MTYQTQEVPVSKEVGRKSTLCGCRPILFNVSLSVIEVVVTVDFVGFPSNEIFSKFPTSVIEITVRIR